MAERKPPFSPISEGFVKCPPSWLAGVRRMQRTGRTCMFTRRKPQIPGNCAQAQILGFLRSRQAL